MFRKTYLFLLLLMCLCMSTAGFTANYTAAAGGVQVQTSFLPLLLTKLQDGWHYTPIVDGPIYTQSNNFVALACSSSACIELGNTYMNSVFSSYFLTSDEENNWHFVQYPQGGFLETLTCNATLCVAAGSANNLPSLVETLDGGKTFTKVNQIANWPVNATSVSINQLSCTNDYCVAAGNYYQANEKHLLFLRRDAQGNWSFIPETAHTPRDSFYFGGLKCLGKLCTIPVNVYNNEIHRVRMLISCDEGLTWAYTPAINGLPPGMSYFEISAIDCTGNFCAAGGDGFQNSQTRLIIISSTNGGKTWNYVRKIQDAPDNYSYLRINAITCNSTMCIAAGRFQSGFSERPMILHADLATNSWYFLRNIEKMPPDYAYAYLISAHCTDTYCLAAGGYNDGVSGVKSMLLESSGAGYIWGFAGPILGMPSNINFATLSGAGTL